MDTTKGLIKWNQTLTILQLLQPHNIQSLMNDDQNDFDELFLKFGKLGVENLHYHLLSKEEPKAVSIEVVLKRRRKLYQ
jgi:hypothetical protein